MLRKNDSRAEPGPKRTIAALSDAVKAVAGRHNPCVGGWAPQFFAEIFEHGGIVRRYCGEIIESFVGAGCETGCSNVMTKNSTIDHLREKARLRNQFAHEVRDVSLPFRCEGLLIARTSAEGN